MKKTKTIQSPSIFEIGSKKVFGVFSTFNNIIKTGILTLLRILEYKKLSIMIHITGVDIVSLWIPKSCISQKLKVLTIFKT